MPQILPITNAPNQNVRAALLVNGQSITLNIYLYYNGQAGFWAMDISDQFGNLLVASVPLITGVWPAANILAPYDYLEIGSAYVINANGAATDFPDDSNLGSGFIVLWDNNPSYAAVAA